jgi:hypothetical protein
VHFISEYLSLTDVRFIAEYGFQALLSKRRHLASRVKRWASAGNARANTTRKKTAAELVDETLKLLEEGRKSITYHENNEEYVMIVGKAGTGEMQNAVHALSQRSVRYILMSIHLPIVS